MSENKTIKTYTAELFLKEKHTLGESPFYDARTKTLSWVDIAEGKLIVIDEAYRDEGTSYHYIQASDYIKIKTANSLTKILDELEIEYVVGKSWTTDAFYRETEKNKTKRVKEGCICVEMECSALQAVCDFRGLELYHFVYTADSLDGTWSRRILGHLELDHRIAYFALAKQISERI